MKKFLLYLLLFLILLFVGLYLAVNSSYMFDKIARRFAPDYNIRYDKVTGDAISGITVEGLYYKDKKLARKIRIKVNPTTLLEDRVTISHLELSGVNEEYLEYMISEFSDDSEDNSSFPFGVRINNAHLSLLPFEISGIKFVQSSLDVDYIYYSEDDFEFGDLHLDAHTSLGKAELEGRYKGRDLYLENLNIKSLNSENIELLLKQNNQRSSSAKELGGALDEESSIFMPRRVVAKNVSVALLPRELFGIKVNVVTLQGRDIDADLQGSNLTGKFDISLATDVGKATIEANTSVDTLDISSVKLSDINLTKIIAVMPKQKKESNVTIESNADKSTSLKIPYLANIIKVDSLDIDFLPTTISDIDISKLQLHAGRVLVDVAKRNIKKGTIQIESNSSIALLSHSGNIVDNVLISNLKVTTKSKLIKQYELPLRDGAIKNINIDATTDINRTKVLVGFEAKKLLDAKKDEFNLDIDKPIIAFTYIFDTAKLSGKVDADIVTKYTKKAHLSADISMKDELMYKGTLSSPQVDAIDPKLASLLKKITIDFNGDINKTSAKISSNDLEGTFHTRGFKTGDLHIQSKDGIDIEKFIKLPEKLSQTKAKIVADIPVVFDKIMPIKAKAKIISNVINMDADILYGDSLKVTAINSFPKDTLLQGFDKSIKFNSLNPMRIALELKGDKLDTKIGSKNIKIVANYNLKSGASSAKINLAGANIAIAGASKKDIKITQSAKSIKELLKAVNSVYGVDLPDISGDISLNADIKDLKSVKATIRSNKLYIGDKKSGTPISNLELIADGDAKGVIISKYSLEAEGAKFYATRPSKIELKGDRVLVAPLWINDMLKSTGEYNLKSKKGQIHSTASQLKIDHELADIVTSLGLKTIVNGDRVALQGSVHLGSGQIKYDLNQKSFSADSDIVILQRQKKKNNYFEKNIKIDIALDSTKPLTYKKPGISVALMPDIKIKKSYGSSLKVNGKIKLIKGGYYSFQNKRFVLKKSYIYFKGKPTAPILNINIVYKHAGTTINVKVSGTASDPYLDFSSDPHMSREQILSYIMFDTSSGGGENKAGDVTNLVAGTLVKSLFASMGLRLDHLVLTGAGFEVGKKISDKITIIYDQEKSSTVKIKIENTKNIETDISFGANSRSADIFYKKEF